MDYRPPLGIQRPQPPQRAVSGSYALQHGLKRPAIPSRLNNVRSVSQPVNVVDLTSDGSATGSAVKPLLRNTNAFLSNGYGSSVYTSPGVIEIDDDDDDDSGRPTKRARAGEDGRSDVVLEVQDSAHQRLPGNALPLPPRRMGLPVISKNVRGKKSVARLARKADGINPPAIATRLPPPKQVADFAPWTGQHPEDVLTETVVKGGYYDKPPGVNSVESNSAKPAVWPNLSAKNNMGLQTLSFLFTSIMDKRQAMGKCTAPSTFKPPPRVTVTDTKREAWLRDLANTDVPLRKQSRTIPHGIRGKVLLEQCLSKDIPMPRAMWLAKCVGANELRAFRRKGVHGSVAANGETKWIREWTISVEQFLESVIAACGQQSWQAKMDYAVRLTTSLYSERLLEREHYLDWIVSCFSQASVERLPIWIILAQLYWKDIISFSRRGRALAEALLGCLHQIMQGTMVANDVLKARLQKLVMAIAVTNRGCLIIPRTWQTYSYLLAPKTATPNSAAQSIVRRCKRLTAPLSKTPRNTRCNLLRLYTCLDGVGLSPDIDKLVLACQAVFPNLDYAVPALLNWAASIFKVGPHRIYLVARIIAQIREKGKDTDGAIVEYLRASHPPAIDVANVHRVIVELTRTGHFSPGRYMQWLITSGALSGGHTSAMSADLLMALPPSILPSHLSSTRLSLLHRLGHAKDEKAVLSSIEYSYKSDCILLSEIRGILNSLSGAARVQLAQSLCLVGIDLAKWREISMRHFCVLRDVLDLVHDFQSLSNFLCAVLKLDDICMLATVADTIALHAKAFAAIDKLQPLVDCSIEQYRTVRSTQNLDRTLILAFTGLCTILPERAEVNRLLENDLSLCDSQMYMAVCSPASDNLVSMQASALDSDNDIDAVFASGNTMDDQLMQRVFTRIVQRAGKVSEGGEHCKKLGDWFNQLRALDSNIFEHLARNYVRASLASSGESIAPSHTISALAASNCIPLKMLLDLAKDVGTPSAACLAIRLLTLASVAHPGLSATDAYHFRTIQCQHQDVCRDKIVPLLATAMQDDKLPVDDEGFLKMLLDYSVQDHHACRQYLLRAPTTPAFLNNCGRIVTNMMGRGSAEEAKLDAKSIVALATPLSVVHCAGALAFLAKVHVSQGSDGALALQSAILEAIANGSEVWPQLLEGAGQETVRGIYQWAKMQVLERDILVNSDELNDQEAIGRNLDILSIAHHAVREDSTPIITTITEKLRAVYSHLSVLGSDTQDTSRLMVSLRALLYLAVLFCVADAAEQDGQHPARAHALAALCILLGHPGLQRHQDVLEYAHDVASALADTVPEDALAVLAQNMHRNGYRDPRLASILGNINRSTDAWLAVVSHPQGSQQHRALMTYQAAQQAARDQRNPGRQLTSPLTSTGQQQPPNQSKAPLRGPVETKVTPYPLRRWEIMSDATPTVGDNDTSLSLNLFGARKVP